MENVDCFHFFAITNNAAKNIHVWAFVNIYLQFMCLTFWSHELLTARLLCPRNSPGKNTRVGCHSLLQGISKPRDWTKFCIAL